MSGIYTPQGFKIHSRSDHKTPWDSAIIDANAGTHSRIKASPPTSGNWPREVDMSIPKFTPSGVPHKNIQRRKSTVGDNRTVLRTTDGHQPCRRRKSTHSDTRTSLQMGILDNTVLRTTDGHQPCRRRKSTHSDTRTSLQMGILNKIVPKPNMSSGVAFYLNVIAKKQLLNVEIKKQRDNRNLLIVRQNKQQQLQHVRLHYLSICSTGLATAKRVYVFILVLCQLCVLANIYIMCCHLCEVFVTQ